MPRVTLLGFELEFTGSHVVDDPPPERIHVPIPRKHKYVAEDEQVNDQPMYVEATYQYIGRCTYKRVS